MIVGEVVKVVDPGRIYSSFDTIFAYAGFKHKTSNPGYGFKVGTIATIFWTGYHPEEGIKLVGLRRESGEEVLMAQEGVRLYTGPEYFKFSSKDPEISFDVNPDYPLSIGMGYAPKGLSERCLIVDNNNWEVETRQLAGSNFTVLLFKKKEQK